MQRMVKFISSLVCAGAFAFGIGNVSAQVVNGGFETAAGTTTGAAGWNNFSTAAAGGVSASATRSLLDPFAGVAELTLAYTNSATPGTGPSVIGQSDIFGGVAAGAVTLTFQAKRVSSAGFENNQVQVQWFDAGNAFISATGFRSYNPTLTGAYSTQTRNYTAPAGTAGALVQFLTAGSAVANDNATIRIDNVTIVPEPSTICLVGLGLLGLLGLRRRKA